MGSSSRRFTPFICKTTSFWAALTNSSREQDGAVFHFCGLLSSTSLSLQRKTARLVCGVFSSTSLDTPLGHFFRYALSVSLPYQANAPTDDAGRHPDSRFREFVISRKLWIDARGLRGRGQSPTSRSLLHAVGQSEPVLSFLSCVKMVAGKLRFGGAWSGVNSKTFILLNIYTNFLSCCI